MKHILKILAVMIIITYSLNLINAHSDLLVFSGLAIIGGAVYLLVTDLNQLFNSFNSKI